MYQTNSPILSSNLQSYSTELQQCSHRIVGPLVLKGTLWDSSPISCSKQDQHRIQIRFLRALSTWVMKTSRNWRVHDSSGPLSQSLITLLMNLFFLQFKHYLCPATMDVSMFSVTSSFVLESLETMPRSDKLLWRK